jgi:hypothetical protein
MLFLGVLEKVVNIFLVRKGNPEEKKTMKALVSGWEVSS